MAGRITEHVTTRGGLTWKGWAGEGPILSTPLAKAEQADAEEGVGSEVSDLCWPWRLLLKPRRLTGLTRPATPLKQG